MTGEDTLRANADVFGPAAPDKGWVPSLRYLLRRQRVLAHLDRNGNGRRVLEVGSGAGMLLQELSRMGYACTALEQSEDARQLAETLRRANGVDVDIRGTPDAAWDASFDVVIAMEVLEHIEDDVAALREWRRWLRPGGSLVLSVPAHAKRWSAADVWAGHFRRYEKAPLHALLEQCGFTVERMESYGFPLANVLEGVSRRYYEKTIRYAEDGTPDRAANDARSGIERTPQLGAFRVLSSWPGRIGVRASYWLQDRFLEGDRGNGYIAVARAS